MKEMKRLISMFLCLVMILGMLPLGALRVNAAETDEKGQLVDAAIVFSDLHAMYSGDTSTGEKGYKQEKVTQMMAALKANNSNLTFSSVHSAGDAFSSNETAYTGYTDTITGYIRTGLGDSTIPVSYLWSDHDRAALNNAKDKVALDKTSHLSYGAGVDGKYGTDDDANYYVYYLSMGDLSSFDRYSTGFGGDRAKNGFTESVEQAITNFKTDTAVLKKDRPLFIVGHQPLFNRRNDNGFAYLWVDAINEVAANMDVAYFFGHNHNYDQNGDYYYAKGSKMTVANMDGWKGFEQGKSSTSSRLKGEEKTLKFTHMCAGYFNPETTKYYGTSRVGTMLVIEVYENSIRYSIQDKSGVFKDNDWDNIDEALDVTIKRDHALSGITVSAPTQTVYTVGDTFSTEDMVVTAVYADGKTAVVTDYTVSTPDMNTAGKQTVTVTYKGKTASFEIQVNEKVTKELVSIRVEAPSKRTYTQGEAFTTEGMKVFAVYSDNTEVEITEGYTVSTPDMNEVGELTVTVTYQEKTATFAITVKAVETPQPSEPEQPEVKEQTFYSEEEGWWAAVTATATGASFTNVYDENNEAVNALLDYYWFGYDIALEGQAAGTAATVMLWLDPEAMSSENLVVYHLNETTGEYEEVTGYTVAKDESEAEYIVIANAALGTYVYGAPKVIVDEDAKLTELKVNALPSKRAYFDSDVVDRIYEITENGETVEVTEKVIYLDIAGMEVVAVYSDGSEVVLDWDEFGKMDGYALTFDQLVVDGAVQYGKKTVTVSYQGKTATFGITVCKSVFDLENQVSIRFSEPSVEDITAVVPETANEVITNAVAALIEGTATVYDIQPTYAEGYSALKGTATVTLPLPEGVTDPVVYYVSDDGKTVEDMNAQLVDGKVVFQTSHFSVFIAGHRVTQNPPSIDDANAVKGEGSLPGATSYKLDTDGVDAGEKYLIVSAASGNHYAFRNNNGSSARQQVTVGTNSTINSGFTNESSSVWTFTSSGTGWYINNGNQRIRLNNNDILNNNGQVLTVTSQNGGAYRISNGSYYLRHSGTSWARSTTQANVYLFKQETAAGTGVTFKLQKPVDMETESTQDLTYEVTLADGTVVTSATITWSSSNNRVATVANGKITSTATEGTINITATLTAVNGTTLSQPIALASVPVTVKAPVITFAVDPDSQDMVLNTTLTPKVAVAINGAAPANYQITWTSSNTDVATVDSNGVITAKGKGDATITATLTTVNGKTVNMVETIAVKVVEKAISKVELVSNTITVERDTPASEEKVVVKVTYEDNSTQNVTLPISELKGTYNLGKNGTYSGLNLTYGNETFENITLKVVNKTGVDNYPNYPNPGSVQLTKTATPLDPNTGLTRVSLSTAGLPAMAGADVIIMLDTSSSMTKNTVTGTNKSRAAVLEESLANLITFLKTPKNGEYMDIRVAIADFNGYYGYDKGGDVMSDINGLGKLEVGTSYDAEDKTDSVRNGNSTGGGYEQKSEARVYTNNTNALDATAFVHVSDLAASYTLNYTSGTNYDYAFDAIAQMATSIQDANALAGEDRALFVIFMSDGASLQWNYFRTQNGYTKWNSWITGAWKETDLTTSNLNATTHSYYYDLTDHDNDGQLNEHRMANAIKGSPNDTFEVIRKNQDDVANQDSLYNRLKPVDGKDNLYTMNGLGATIFTINFDAKQDGQITVASIDKALASTASDQTGATKYYYKVTTANQLNNAFNTIGGEIQIAASKAVFVDQMGESFNLQLATKVPTSARDDDGNTVYEEGVDTSITVSETKLFTRAMVGTTIELENGTEYTVQESDIGKAYGSSYVKETVTFSADGKTATSDKKTGNILGEDGILRADSFFYNTNPYSVTVTLKDGRTKSLLPESFCWDVGTVNEKKLTLSYVVYLEGSMQGGREAGSYATNNLAEMSYVNWVGNDASQKVESPVVSWKGAQVSYAFYLVTEAGYPAYADGTRAPNIEEAYKVTRPVVYHSIKLNSGENLMSTVADDVLPEGYVLFDPAAVYNVYVASGDSGTNRWQITSGTMGPDGKPTTYVYGYNDKHEYSNATPVSDATYKYTDTTVYFAVKWIPSAIPDAVVVDYGLPVDINVLVNDQFGTTGVLKGLAVSKPASLGDKTHLTSEQGFINKLAQGNGGLKFGTAEINGSKVTYTPGDMLMNSFDKFAYEVYYVAADSAQTGYYFGEVTVIPATTIYYEDSFVDLWVETRDENNAWVKNENLHWTQGTPAGMKQDEDRPGHFSLGSIDADNVYGNDGAYEEMSTYSLDSTAKITVKTGTRGKAQFEFYGTGFDLIGVTSDTTGTITVAVQGANGGATRNFMVDTFYGFEMKGNDWVLEDNAPDALYQVPVMKVAGLPYNKYTVTITAAFSTIFDHEQDCTCETADCEGCYELYLDAIRIYDPAGTEYGENGDTNGGNNKIDDTIQDAYIADGEGWPLYLELRNQIISAKTFGQIKDLNDGTTIKGAVFIEGKDEVVDVADYTSFGPNNEVYLTQGQSIAFSLDLKNIPNIANIADVQIGLKVGNGDTVSYKVYDATVSGAADANVKHLNTATDMYYSIKDHAFGTTVITNTGGGILSITNIKITYKQDPYATGEAAELNMTVEDVAAVLASLNSKPAEEDEIPENPEANVVERLAGDNRYTTAIKTADELKAILGVEKFQNIIVASGEQFADALAGSYLAAVKDAPILLVKSRDQEINAVKSYIEANLASDGTVYLLGGINAVSKKVETALAGVNVKRLGGNDRYATNLLILQEAGMAGKDVVVCTGKNFADSLSASAVGLPILLVKDSLSAEQKAILGNTGKIYVVGGENAISKRVAEQLAAYGDVIRVAGETRYETSILVAETFFSEPKAAVVAYGENFPDGLSGGPLAYACGAPLILTCEGKTTFAAEYMAENAIKSGYVQGGTAVLPEKVINTVFALELKEG